jgi:hypothetical protein
MQRLMGKPTHHLGEFDGLEYWKDTYDRLWRLEPETDRGEEVDPEQTIAELTAVRDRLQAEKPQPDTLTALTALLDRLTDAYGAEPSGG